MSARPDTVDASKKVTLEQALEMIKDGSHIVAAMAAAEPLKLMTHLGQRAQALRNVTLYCANPSQDFPCFWDPALEDRLTIEVMFLTEKIRRRQGYGRVHYVPQHLSQWVRHLTRKSSLDIFWGTCSLPDSRGFVSLGTGAVYETEMVRLAKRIILEVNPQMPVTSGATLVPLTWVDHLIESDHPLPALERPSMSEEDHKIAHYVADLVENGSTIQLGIGSIPNAIGLALRSKKDLGVHTEMINDTMMDLYLEGVITGRKKTLWPGKILGAFAYGTKHLYQFLHDNPAIELQPASVVNDPYRIGRNYKMISINSAVEVDLTGQVCSESVGHNELSGVGGAFDTHVGAQRSEGGRGIIAMRSTAAGGKVSKIVFELAPGAKVSIGRNDIDTVVTEYGVAQLSGKSVAQRVKAMVAIAHPQFRDELLAQAKRFHYL
jgi:acyl-CoA hydrolase